MENDEAKDQPNYLLKGDLSGIQEFIFNVQSKGAAKTLKVRSYIIQMISHLAYRFCLNKLPGSEPFYEGGGNFFIQFTSSHNKVEAIINELQNDINMNLLTEDFAITLSYVPVHDNFGEAWTILRKEGNRKKLTQFSQLISFFTPFLKKNAEAESNEVKIPENIKSLLEKTGLEESNDLYTLLNTELVKYSQFEYQLLGETVSKTKVDFNGKLINKLPFWRNYEELDAYMLYRKEREKLYSDDRKIKVENIQNIVDFDALGDFAAHRTGTNKIAILKLDVDNLGWVFRSQKDHKDVKDLSYRFSRFFDEQLFELFEHDSFSLSGIPEKYNANIYPVFAGGDDCFIIGGWDAVLCFANNLHERFVKEFDDSYSLSAGIVIVSPTHPVVSFSELVEETLSKAKKREGKNSVCFFDLVFSWKEYQSIISICSKLRQSMEEQNINRSYLNRIRKSAKGFNALQNKNGVDFNKIYKLKYYLARQDEKLQDVVELLFEPYYESLNNKLFGKGDDLDTSIYPTIARITELLTKTKLKYE